MAVSLGDTDITYYNVGRLTRTMLVFDPMEVEAPEADWFYQNDTGGVPTDEIDDNYEAAEESLSKISKEDF